MDISERLKLVKNNMNWGKPRKCSVRRAPIKRAKGFLHLQSLNWGTVNHYVCKDCISVAAELALHVDDAAYYEEEVK